MDALPKKFIRLSPTCRIVRGAKYSLVIDFEEGSLHRINSSAEQILSLGESGRSVQEIAEKTGIDDDTTLSFINEMQSKGFLCPHADPEVQQDEAQASPGAETDTTRLDFIWIEVTSRCNLRCVHCYADDGHRAGAEPSIGDIRDWLSQAAALGARTIQFTGGECTLRADIKECICQAMDIGYEYIEIFTNGTSLTDPLIEFLAKNHVHIALSLYSYKPNAHDAISGVPGSHERTIEALKHRLAYDVQVRGSIIAMKQNESDLKATQIFLQELGAPSGPADPIRPCGKGASLKHWPEKYGLSIMKTEPQFPVHRGFFERNQCWNSCWSGKAAITPQGKVIPCVFARDQVAGDLHHQSLESILRDGLMPFWRLTRGTSMQSRPHALTILTRESGDLQKLHSRNMFNTLAG